MESLKGTDIENLDEARALELLVEYNEEILRLNLELEEKTLHKYLLEERIRALQNQRTSLNRMPNELMVAIFREATDIQYLALGPILLVCRKWYQLAINSPSLWNTISLFFQDKPSSTAINCGLRYVESALQYSQQVPLDIDLYLPCQTDVVDYLTRRFLGILEDDSRDPLIQERFMKLYDWIDAGIMSDSDNMVFYHDIANGLSQLMATLAGLNGQNLLRLRSFYLEYNSNELADWVDDELFRHPTPILEELQIKLHGHHDPFDVYPIFFLPAPKLSRVSIDPRYPIEPLISSNHPVKSLRLDLWAAFDSLPDHSFLQNLVYLSIIGSESSVRGDRQDIVLPSLRDLTIRSSRLGIGIKAPKLDILRIFAGFGVFDRLEISSVPHFPSIRKLHWDCSIGDGKSKPFLNFVGLHQLLGEIGIVNEDIVRVKEFICLIKDDPQCSKFKVGGYEARPGALVSWFAPFPYESHQIELDI